jgi:hypothetical protein
MRFAAPFLLTTGLLLAGCSGAPVKQATIKEKEAARTEVLAKVTGWARMFTPDVATGAANQLGFHPTPYAAAKQGFASTGGPVTIANSFSKTPNQVSYRATGADAEQIDNIAFDLAETDAKSAGEARKRLATLVRDFLYQSKIDAAPLLPAIAEGVPARGDLTGTRYSIDKSPDGHLTVAFTRTGAQSPANSKTQGN